jgi:hypothetical protein
MKKNLLNIASCKAIKCGVNPFLQEAVCELQKSRTKARFDHMVTHLIKGTTYHPIHQITMGK